MWGEKTACNRDGCASLRPLNVTCLRRSGVSLHAAVEWAFGEERILFDGDWPVVLLASQYGRWYETLEALTARLPLPARRKLWAENAQRVYRLDS